MGQETWWQAFIRSPLEIILVFLMFPFVLIFGGIATLIDKFRKD